MKSFTFIVIAYNHEKYIIEHLESIKYLVQNYADNIEVDLIINDDKSRDLTVYLVNKWLSVNSELFRSVIKIFNNENLGTCKSLLNVINEVKTDSIKITAGDDVYSFENLFLYSFQINNNFISGFPLDLTDNILSEKKIDIYMIISSYFIYRKKPAITRFKFPSNNNAPNMIYDINNLKDKKVKDFLNNFDVVEDLPLQISIVRNFNSKFCLVDKVFTYYRRTSGSTFIVAGNRFYNDQIKIFDDLILNESKKVDIFLIKNRKFCFKIKNKFIKRIINISLYLFVMNVFLNFINILMMRKKINLKLNIHKQHYEYIQSKAKIFKID